MRGKEINSMKPVTFSRAFAEYSEVNVYGSTMPRRTLAMFSVLRNSSTGISIAFTFVISGWIRDSLP